MKRVKWFIDQDSPSSTPCIPSSSFLMTDPIIYQRSRLECGVMPSVRRRWLTILLIVVVVSKCSKERGEGRE